MVLVVFTWLLLMGHCRETPRRIKSELTMQLFKVRKKMRVDYAADCLGVASKTLDFLNDPKFIAAWNFASEHSRAGWASEGGVPDIRWRTHLAIWCAKHCESIEGDFVECGVYTGLLSLSICHYLQFQNSPKSFYLFDLWDKIPLDAVDEAERADVARRNENLYGSHQVFNDVQEAFSRFPNCKFIKGMLPGTLTSAPEKISYLSIDLNNSPTERACIEELWPRISPGGMVIIDDYGWRGHEIQRKMWDDFAAEKNHLIANLPTAQGLLIKSR